MFLRTITRYILSLLLWPTVLITFSLTAIVWLLQALRYVDFIINRGLSVGDFLYLTILILPSLLTVILPVSLLIAIIVMYHKLLAESELIVMRASGLSRWKLARPAMIAGLSVSVITYALTLHILPHANARFKDMREFLKDNYASVLLQEEVFNHPAEGVTVFVRERNDDGTLAGILVHDNRDEGNIVTMMADEAVLQTTDSGPRFLLANGIRQERRNGRLSWLNFDSYALDLNYYAGSGLQRSRGESELGFARLLMARDVASSPAERASYNAEIHKRLTWPLMAFTLAIFAVSMLTTGQYNRRGMWKRLTGLSVACAVIIVGYFALSSMLIKQPLFIGGLYGYIAAIIVTSCTFLSLYASPSIPSDGAEPFAAQPV